MTQEKDKRVTEDRVWEFQEVLVLSLQTMLPLKAHLEGWQGLEFITLLLDPHSIWSDHFHIAIGPFNW